MKKLLPLFLVLVLALCVLASCQLPELPPPEDDGTGTFNPGEEPGENPGEQPGENPGEEPGENPTPEVDEDLQAAYDYIKLTYKTLNVTSANFEVMKNAPIGEKIFAVTWSVDNAAITISESEDGSFYVVNVPELGAQAVNYTLNFSIQNDKGEKKEGSFSLTVPAYKVNTFDEYVAAEDGEALVIQGIVTGVISKSTNSTKENSLFLQDLNGNGGYYAYNLEEDPNGVIKVGMTVEVSGKKKNYNGTFELTSPVAKIIDETIKPVTPVDFTEVLASAEGLDADALVKKNGMLVTIKGVTLLEYVESNGYHYFKLGDHKTYLRVSSSSNCITQDEGDALTETFLANFQSKADVTGIVAVYNGDFYLMPVSVNAFENFVEQETTEDVKIATVIENLKVPGMIQLAGETELPAAFSGFSDVTISWKLVSGACATLSGNKLTVTIPTAAEEVVVEATVACGKVSDSKEYTITVKDISTITIQEADNMVADFVKNQYTEELFYVSGTVQQISSDIYGNMYIVAMIDGAEYGIDIYGLYDEDGHKYGDFTGHKPQVGDFVTVRTVVGKYNNTQLKNAVLVAYEHEHSFVNGECACGAEDPDFVPTHTCADADGDFVCDNDDCTKVVAPAADSVLSIADAIKLAGVLGANKYTADKYYIIAEISEVYNATYGNMYIKDAAGTTLTIYGTYSADGKTRYDAMTAKPVAGDTVTVYGVIGSYNTTPQMKNAWITAFDHEHVFVNGKCACGAADPDFIPTHTCADENGDFVCDVDGCDEVIAPAADSTLTIAQAIQLGTLLGGKYTEGKYYVEGVITEVYNTTHGNMYIKDADGTTLTIYGTYSADGKTRYDAMNEKPVAGDTVTVYGVIGSYNQAPQMKNAWITEFVHEHTFVDGVCSGCGASSHEHVYDAVVTDPTCEADGYITYTCEGCGDSYTEAGKESSGHAWDEVGTCLVCGAQNHEHVYDEVVTAPTCTEAGYTTYSCTVEGCNKSYTDNATDALGHAYTDGVCANGCGIDDPTYYFPMSITDALAAADGKKVQVFGTVTNIGTPYNEGYNNISLTITDADGNELYIYRLNGNYALNDMITVQGVMATYKGARQIAQGATATLHECSEYTEATCEKLAACVVCGATTGEYADHNYVDGACSVCGALDHVHSYTPVVTEPTCTEAGYITYTCECKDFYTEEGEAALGHAYTDGVCANGCGTEDPDYYYPMSITEALSAPVGKKVLLTGTISAIKSEWDTGYKNMEAYLSDGDGNQILLYRIKTQVVVGDKVTVQGAIGVYNNVNQIAQGTSTVTITEKHVCSEYTEATCTERAKCVICGTATGELAEHTMVNGVCSACGHKEGEAEIVELSLSFADKANRTSQTTSQQVWEQNGITLTNDKGSSTSNIADYANPARFYKSSKLTIEVDGKQITKIVFTCSESKYTTALQNSITAADGGTVSVSGNVITVEFATPVDSYVIASLTGGQVRMNSLVVYAQ